MQIDIAEICKRLGLKRYEMAALIGECHTTISRLGSSPTHRPMTTRFYWLVQTFAHEAVVALLDYWKDNKPNNELHVRRLIRIARRFKQPEEFEIWEAAILGHYQ